MPVTLIQSVYRKTKDKTQGKRNEKKIHLFAGVVYYTAAESLFVERDNSLHVQYNVEKTNQPTIC